MHYLTKFALGITAANDPSPCKGEAAQQQRSSFLLAGAGPARLSPLGGPAAAAAATQAPFRATPQSPGRAANYQYPSLSVLQTSHGPDLHETQLGLQTY